MPAPVLENKKMTSSRDKEQLRKPTQKSSSQQSETSQRPDRMVSRACWWKPF